MQTLKTRRQFLATCATTAAAFGALRIPGVRAAQLAGAPLYKISRPDKAKPDAKVESYGIEHGEAGRELDSVRELRQQVEATREQLAAKRRLPRNTMPASAVYLTREYRPRYRL